MLHHLLDASASFGSELHLAFGCCTHSWNRQQWRAFSGLQRKLPIRTRGRSDDAACPEERPSVAKRQRDQEFATKN
jgi:hypothetical protein